MPTVPLRAAALPVSNVNVTGRLELAVPETLTVVRVFSGTALGSAAIVMVWLAFATNSVPVADPVNFVSLKDWVQGLDLNQRPSGYETKELPLRREVSEVSVTRRRPWY